MNIDAAIDSELASAEKWTWTYWWVHTTMVAASIVLTLLPVVILAVSAEVTVRTRNAIVAVTGVALIIQVLDAVMAFGGRYRWFASRLGRLRVMKIGREMNKLDDDRAIARYQRLMHELPDQPAP